MKKKILAATMLSLAFSLSVTAKPTSEIEPYSPAIFKRVELPEKYTVVLEPHDLVVPSSRPDVAPKTKPKVIDTTPKVATSNSVKGVASWYCKSGVSRCHYKYSGGMYAAVKRSMLYLRGSKVNVCTPDNCIVVTVIDCNCGPNANVIDLYADAFQKLAPLSDGTVKVTVKW